MNPRIANGRHDERIDRVLHNIGSATPPAGLEERITARLARERAKAPVAVTGGILFFGIPRIAFGMTATAVACIGIVAGSVHHSHKIQPMLPGFEPRPLSGAMGSAGAQRPAQRPVPASPAGHPRSERRQPEGRAIISPQSQKPAGVAVPKTPVQP